MLEELPLSRSQSLTLVPVNGPVGHRTSGDRGQGHAWLPASSCSPRMAGGLERPRERSPRCVHPGEGHASVLPSSPGSDETGSPEQGCASLPQDPKHGGGGRREWRGRGAHRARGPWVLPHGPSGQDAAGAGVQPPPSVPLTISGPLGLLLGAAHLRPLCRWALRPQGRSAVTQGAGRRGACTPGGCGAGTAGPYTCQPGRRSRGSLTRPYWPGTGPPLGFLPSPPASPSPWVLRGALPQEALSSPAPVPRACCGGSRADTALCQAHEVSVIERNPRGKDSALEATRRCQRDAACS